MKNFLRCSLLLITTFSLSAFAVDPEKSGWLVDTKEQLKGQIKKQIANLELKTDVKIFSADITEGINASMKYTYQLEPSYKAGYYTRVDRWKLSTDLRAGDMIQKAAGSALPVYLNINSGDEIVFIRHFKNQWVAAREIPYTPYNLPLTAAHAREHMKPGDFVSIPTEMNILMGGNYGIPIVTPAYLSVNANLGASYLVSSHFQIQIMKMADERVKLKLIAMRRQGSNTGLGASWGLHVFQLPEIKDLNLKYAKKLKTGQDIVDDQVKDYIEDQVDSSVNGLFERDLTSLSFNKNSGKLFEIDYIFDLKDNDAALAYTELLSSTYRFKKLELFKSFLTDQFGVDKDASKILITDLDSVEKLVQEDKNKDPSQRRVERLFKGQNDFNGFGRNWKFGAILFRTSGATSNHEDLISYFNLDNERNNVLYVSNSKTKSHGFIRDLLKEEQYWNNFMLFRVNDRGNLLDNSLTDIGINYNLNDKMMTNHEQLQFQEEMKMNLPEKIFSNIPWEKMITPGFSQKNININFQLLFDRRIMNVIRDLTSSDILERLQYFNADSKLLTLNEMKELASTLDECFINVDKDEAGSREKVEKIAKIQRSRLFTKYGPRLLFSFLNDEQVSKYVYFRLYWGSTEVAPIEFIYGSNPSSELFPVFQRMQFLIDQGHFNLKIVEFDPELVQK